MCMGGRPKDNSAEIAREQAEKNEMRIREGTGRVDQAFSGFDDNYYSGLGKSYLDYYQPDLERQYADAQKKNTFRFANSGNLDSGASNESFGDLAEHYTQQRAQLADRSLSEQQNARGQVAQNRADLISQLESGSGVESTAQSALARASSLSQPPEYSPLGDMFSQFTGALANSAAMQSKGYQGIPGTKNLFNTRGTTSVRTVT